MQVLTIWDIILPPFYLSMFYFIAIKIQNKRLKQHIYYEYYVKGLFAKFIGVIGLSLVYNFYYKGGDTFNYFQSATCLVNLFSNDSSAFFDILLRGITSESYSNFDIDTGYPFYYFDKNAFMVARIITPLLILSFKSYITSSLLLAFICYAGIWRLYEMFVGYFPALHKQLAISILFIPSVVFWGSGILKDTITISAVGWYTYSFNKFFIKREIKIIHLLAIFLGSYLLISIKPYIFIALLPGSLIWLSIESISKIKNRLIKYILTPFIAGIAIMSGFLAIVQLGDILEKYSVDKVLDRAVVVQQDLIRDDYGGNHFDIGSFDPTLLGVLGKAPIAISATLFRPFLWEIKNPVMFLSSIENTVIMGFTIMLLIQIKIAGVFVIITRHPLLLFSFLFSLFFAFSVGLTTPNFGALVRLKIPCIPFYVSSLFIMRYYYNQNKLT